MELLLVLLILGILLGLGFPAFSRVMAARLELRCTASLRQVGVLLQVYAVDHRDAFPFAGERSKVISVPSVGYSVSVGSFEGFGSGKYAALFPDHWSSAGWDRGLMCPGTPKFTLEPAPPLDQKWAGTWTGFPNRLMPAYFLSEAIPLDPAVLARGYVGTLWPRLNRWSDVIFPSSKALLYENTAFCLPTPEQREYALRWGDTFAWSTSVMAVDGSVRRKPVRASMEFTHFMLFDSAGYTTINGIRGRDW